MMAKTMTVVCLKRLCAQQRALKNSLKCAFTCQRLELYTNQVPHRSCRDDQVTSVTADRQTDGQTAFQLNTVDCKIKTHNQYQLVGLYKSCSSSFQTVQQNLWNF